jgi:hypothetical protein
MGFVQSTAEGAKYGKALTKIICEENAVLMKPRFVLP